MCFCLSAGRPKRRLLNVKDQKLGPIRKTESGMRLSQRLKEKPLNVYQHDVNYVSDSQDSQESQDSQDCQISQPSQPLPSGSQESKKSEDSNLSKDSDLERKLATSDSVYRLLDALLVLIIYIL